MKFCHKRACCMRSERLLLEDIVGAANAIAEFTNGHSSESFEASALVRSAVVHQLTIIGEAAAQLPQQLRTTRPEIPWADIQGLRNIVGHNSFGIDWPAVWLAATADVPVLRDQVIEILHSLG
jgi:uncharacterized protein with HEPN domain